MIFSVIIPLYNKELYIQRTLDSVLVQTFPDYEIIVVDDSSTDNSLELASKYISNNVKTIRKEKGQKGPAATRNLGVCNASGEWIAFLDADDKWYPEHLSKLHGLIEKDPNINFISNGWDKGTEDKSFSKDKYTDYWLKNKYNPVVGLEKYLIETIADHPPFCSSACAVRKNSLLESGGFPENMVRGEDIDTWLRLMYNNKRALRSLYIGATYFRDDEDSITRKTIPTLERFGLPDTDLEIIKESRNKKLTYLLMKFTNYYLMMGLQSRLKQLVLHHCDVKSLFFRVDKLKYIKYLFLSIIPNKLLGIGKYLYKKIKTWT